MSPSRVLCASPPDGGALPSPSVARTPCIGAEMRTAIIGGHNAAAAGPVAGSQAPAKPLLMFCYADRERGACQRLLSGPIFVTDPAAADSANVPAVRARPPRCARVSKCLTQGRCHRVPPRGVRLCMPSSWAALWRNVSSGAATLMLATRRISRSPLRWVRARPNSLASIMASLASRGAVRCRRSTLQEDRAPWRGVRCWSSVRSEVVQAVSMDNSTGGSCLTEPMLSRLI
jgi:hypothetical protein